MAEDTERAKSQARAQIDTLVEMMSALTKAQDEGEAEYDGEMCDEDYIRERISEDPLSVQVRSDWHTPGDEGESVEFEILLCTGGPAVRIIGELRENYNEPESATVQYQDWFTPWVDYSETTEEEDKAILRYCQHFYYGE